MSVGRSIAPARPFPSHFLSLPSVVNRYHLLSVLSLRDISASERKSLWSNDTNHFEDCADVLEISSIYSFVHCIIAWCITPSFKIVLCLFVCVTDISQNVFDHLDICHLSWNIRIMLRIARLENTIFYLSKIRSLLLGQKYWPPSISNMVLPTHLRRFEESKVVPTILQGCGLW